MIDIEATAAPAEELSEQPEPVEQKPREESGKFYLGLDGMPYPSSSFVTAEENGERGWISPGEIKGFIPIERRKEYSRDFNKKENKYRAGDRDE